MECDVKIKILVVTDGNRWIAHGESASSESESLCHIEVECNPQWQTDLSKDMICVVEAEIPYTPNRLQTIAGILVAPTQP
jgi:hypothetical protein